MSDAVFIIRNQRGQFWARAGEWVDGREPQRILKLKHQDEAVNQLVELSARDIDLRGEVTSCELGERGEPQVTVSEHKTPTQAEKAAAEAAEAAEDDGTEEMEGETDLSKEEPADPSLTAPA